MVDSGKFALLIPAYTSVEVLSSLAFARKVIDLGCREVCCVGDFSDLLENAIDAMLEADGRIDVVTTSLMEEREAIEYFLFAAGGAESDLDLVAVVGKHVSLEHELVNLAGCA